MIVQDVGLARLIRAVTPDLEIHASTQMSVTGAEGVRLARELGCSRVILARELSLREIARIREEAELPVEVFVHGALCVAYSGQCLTSEALGGRSANRGECAQACRLPYEIVCDGELQDLGRHQVSPEPAGPRGLRPDPPAGRAGGGQPQDRGAAQDARVRGQHHPPLPAGDRRGRRRPARRRSTAGDVREMELSFSRGFSHGFFDGNNHKVLVRGDYAKKRGVFVGEVAADRRRPGPPRPRRARSSPATAWSSTATKRPGVPEQGGRVYEVVRVAARSPAAIAGPVGPEGLSAGPAELGFGRRDLDLRQLRPGQRVWKTDDPELTRRLRQSFEGPAARQGRARTSSIRAVVGEPLRLEARAANGASAVVDRRRSAGRRRQPAGDDRRPPRPARPARRHDLRARRVRRPRSRAGRWSPGAS